MLLKMHCVIYITKEMTIKHHIQNNEMGFHALCTM